MWFNYRTYFFVDDGLKIRTSVKHAINGPVTNQIRDYWFEILQKSNAIKKKQHEDLNVQDLQNIFSSEMEISLA